jgi:DNA-binding NarL/FixJ family response regulator
MVEAVPHTIRVLIADDEPLVRAGVRAVLAAGGGVDVVAEAADGREAVELTSRHRPDVALLDIRMPRLDGIAAAAEIHRTAPGTGVLMLTTFGEDAYILRALGQDGDGGRAGGFLLKSGPPEELIAGVRAVADGAAYLSPRVAARVIAHLGAARPAPSDAGRRVAALTPRERDVLALIGAGLSNRQIARRLGLTEGTVKTYVSAVLARLGVRNRAAAAVTAHEAGLVPPPPTG